PPNEKIVRALAQKLSEKVMPILEKQDEVKARYTAAKEAFMLNPGKHCYTHADANLGNFIVDLEQKRIHLGGLGRLGPQENMPTGVAAEDFHRFSFGIAWLQRSSPIDNELVAAAQGSFTKGYKEDGTPISKEADNYFQTYWSIRA